MTRRLLLGRLEPRAEHMRRVILNLHGLGPVPDHVEADEARYWVPADLLEEAVALAQRHAEKVKTSFTFDDGNRSDLELGAPILARGGYPAIFFVLSDRFGDPRYLDAAALQELQRMGHAIGSHGAAHVDWTTQDEAGLQCELIEARARIAEAAGTPVLEAAIPFGRYNGRVLRALRAAGFRRAYSSDGGVAGRSDWPVARTSLRADMDGAAVEAILLGQEPLTRRLRRRAAMAVKARI